MNIKMNYLAVVASAALVLSMTPACASAQSDQAAPAAPAADAQTEQNHILTTEQEHEAAQKRAVEVAAKRAAALKEALAQPTPRMADGHPDISGVWGGGGGGITVHKDAEGTIHVTFPAREAPKSVDPDGKLVEYYLQVDGDRNRANNKNKPQYKDEYLSKVRELDKGENQMDPSVSCHPTGVPRAFPHQIFSVPGYVVMWYTGENSGHYRIIPTSGGTHADGAYDTYWGDSVGHWEGDTLVIDITHFNDRTWLGSDGWFHTNGMHVIEKISREGNVLHYQSSVEDSVLKQPWNPNPRTLLLNNDANNYVFEDLPCKDFDQEHFVNHDHF
jgi:hypothetical protein